MQQCESLGGGGGKRGGGGTRQAQIQVQKSRALTYALNVASISHGNVHRSTLVNSEVLHRPDMTHFDCRIPCRLDSNDSECLQYKG